MRVLEEKCSPELLKQWQHLPDYKNHVERQEHQNKTQNKTNARPGHNNVNYAGETWPLTAELQRRIQSLEFRCFRKILGVSYKDRITNEQVRKTIIKQIGPYEDLLATVQRRKLKWYGHVTRSDGLTKVILQGTVEGGRRRGRPKKSWIDNIAEWTGKSFAETQAMAHNRQEWRELTRKSVMTRPYGSSRS